MTTDIEKQFFDTFGIEPKFKGYSNTEELSTGCVIPCGNIKYFNTIEEMDKANYWCFNMWELDEEDKDYPQITDRILLELICILSQHYSWGEENWFIERTTIGELKEWLLEEFIEIDKIGLSKIIKQQVQELFKEEQ